MIHRKDIQQHKNAFSVKEINTLRSTNIEKD